MPEPPPYERGRLSRAFVPDDSDACHADRFVARSGGGDDEDEVAALDLLVVAADREPLDGAADRGR